tara:strand:+ start:316 stop:570 length:255 start_codon:yes stop_codon:yes gene_type:complete
LIQIIDKTGTRWWTGKKYGDENVGRVFAKHMEEEEEEGERGTRRKKWGAKTSKLSKMWRRKKMQNHIISPTKISGMNLLKKKEK